MSYESLGENAMILPLPVQRSSGEKSLRFIDLHDYNEFFDDLAKGFPYHSPAISIGCGGPPACDSMLEVFNVGNYIASFVPTLDDFSRLDLRFSLPKKTWEQVPQYLEYGFAVFQLAQGNLRPHPMAFEFETNIQSIYFPTMHIHDGEVHDIEEFDHTLYMQHAGLDSVSYDYRNSNVPDDSTGLVRSEFVAARFCDTARSQGIVDENLLVHKKQIRDYQPNQDTEIFVAGDAVKKSFNPRRLLVFSPWLVVLAGITWFINRRNRIAKTGNSQN